jgi:hypothetical protein
VGIDQIARGEFLDEKQDEKQMDARVARMMKA